MEDWTRDIEEKLGVAVEQYEYQHLVPELPPLKPIKLSFEINHDDENT